MRKQTQVKLIKDEPSYKQTTGSKNEPNIILCGNRSATVTYGHMTG
jgi:hypothetical protein